MAEINMTVDYRVLGALGTNCYLIARQKQCIIVDPADDLLKIKEMVEKSGCTLRGILLTHGHSDHMLAAGALRAAYQVPVFAGEHEKQLLNNAQDNLSAPMLGEAVTLSADCWLKDGQIIEPAGFALRVLFTPGHTPGGVCYYAEEGPYLFSGDTLFAESIGRTDFPGGSMSALVRAVREKLFVLPEETKVFPGHGGQTTIAYEKKYNPFCR